MVYVWASSGTRKITYGSVPFAPQNGQGSGLREKKCQVVNGAIQRTDVEFKVKSGPCPADLVDSVEVETENYDSNNDEDKGKALNSSSSLQKLVKSTERISGECSAERACSSGPKNSIKSGTTNAQKDTMRLKHEQAGIFSSNISLSGAVREGPTGLEVHCSMSNVSPDSSKYCINQSPSPRVQPSLAHSPQLLGGVTSTGSARASKSTPKKSSAYTCFPSNKLAPAGSADSQCKKPLENVPVGHGFVSSPLKMGSDTETNLLETNKSASAGENRHI
ncbi:hypothetical protein FOCC_FOCC004799 [Frankliniella occidentalis]|nr:hypothetical protein FOCC_FOCC004799 [Frankliniella occidentalis]